ncbi:hypothetical protein PS273GM_17085 [Stutzerimonas stutzeri]|uniref:Uncharacterized protein n=1 Tax=Stutzerimonas stutzeri TaxID=316 RepID=A0A172WTF7_STUST|nr:hypothetical protein PS273GM_17085 [Stutzerimonas stutzeri]
MRMYRTLSFGRRFAASGQVAWFRRGALCLSGRFGLERWCTWSAADAGFIRGVVGTRLLLHGLAEATRDVRLPHRQLKWLLTRLETSIFLQLQIRVESKH